MSNTELHYKPITEQAAMLRAGELSPVELTRRTLTAFPRSTTT